MIFFAAICAIAHIRKRSENGGSDERKQAINKTREVDDPSVANISRLK